MTEKTSIINQSQSDVDILKINEEIEQKIRQFKSTLAEKGVRQVDIAKNLGVSPSVVSRVIAGVGRSEYIELALRRHGVNMKELHALILLKGVAV